MAGLKRKSAGDLPKAANGAATPKKLKSSASATLPKSKTKTKSAPVPPAKKQKKNLSKKRKESGSEDLVESDTTEDENGYFGFSAKDDQDGSEDDDEFEGFESEVEEDAMSVDGDDQEAGTSKDAALNGTSSRESHAKQKALAKERKAAKPNSGEIEKTKRIWDRLRLKTGVEKEERIQLVDELLDIVRGRIRDFVFKHDVVRTLQSAAKYGDMEQRRTIAKELKGEFRALAESKYAKFLVAKLLVEGDNDIREMIIPEFYGHIRRLINHPEASWIVDDVYRQMATKEQKAKMLREWYGPEYAVFKSAEKNPSADLAKILEKEPEKRKPIMKYLYGLINQLIQKQLSGFTMLHDAILQYFLNTKPGTEEANSFLELIKGDEEGDLLRNLAFTKGGSRVVGLALAYANAKDRKNILRVYKDHIETLATDSNGHMVLLAGLEVTDDTKLTGRLILNELIGIGKETPEESQIEKIVTLVNDLNGRIPLLYPFAGTSRWLISQKEYPIVQEYQDVRASTSKKDPDVRRKELALPIANLCFATIASHASTLTQNSFGCQFIETVLCGPAESPERKSAALAAVAAIAAGDPNADGHLSRSFHGGRMLRTLVQGGQWSAAAQSVEATDPPRGFANTLYESIQPHVVDWACGDSPFVIVNMLERAEGFEHKDDLISRLRASQEKIKKAATEETAAQKAKRDEVEKKSTGKGKKGKVVKAQVGNPGAQQLLELIS